MENKPVRVGPPRKRSLEKISLAELLFGFASIFVILAIIMLVGIRLTPSIAATVLFAVALVVSVWRYGRGS
jgi:Flp pilus assembly protein TadB